MSFQDFMNKIRYWDNQAAKWMIRHFYILFFEIFLILIFMALFVVALKTIDISELIAQESILDRLLFLQTVNSGIIILLLLLNSFWMLYVFSGIMRIRSLLKEISLGITKHQK